MADEKIKYTFTRFSSYDDGRPQTLDQDGRKVRREATVNWWTAIKCLLTLNHFDPGVFQDDQGNWHCRRCNRQVKI